MRSVQGMTRWSLEHNLIKWTELNRNVKGAPWSWSWRGRDFSFLLPIYRDTSPYIVIVKARQLAVSEYCINWMFNNLLQYHHTTGIHVFPNDTQSKKFSKLRILPDIFSKKVIISDDNYYSRYADNVSHKHLSNASNYILSFIGGVQRAKSTDARSISADFLILDEAKDLPQGDIADVEECLSMSPYKLKRIIGTPDFPDTEFDKRYQLSDQHEWVVSCEGCGYSAPLSFDFILAGADGFFYGCPKCSHAIDKAAGHWEAQNSDGHYRGYHISQLIANWISADEIMEKKASPSYYPQKFANEVLGLAYSGGEKPIPFAKLMGCAISDMERWPAGFERISVGVDWGNVSHYVILGVSDNDYFLVDFGVLDRQSVLSHAKEVIKIAEARPDAVLILDSGYGKAQNQLIFKELRNRAWSCFYKDSAMVPEFSTISRSGKQALDEEDYEFHVTVSHSTMSEIVANHISERRIHFWLDGNVDPHSALHEFLSEITLVSTEQSGNKRKWHTTQAHYFMCLFYALIGFYTEAEDEGFFYSKAQ